MKVKIIKKHIYHSIDAFFNILDVKGGDEYNFIILCLGFKKVIRHEDILSRMQRNDVTRSKALLEILRKTMDGFDGEQEFNILGFSRLTPEMEETKKTLSQPYVYSVDDTVVMVHGTIPGAEEIAEHEGISIDVDTELFAHLPFDLVCDKTERAGGKISAISVGPDGDFEYYQNGLGLYKFTYTYDQDLNWSVVTNIDLRKNSNYILNDIYDAPSKVGEKPRIIALFSGGLDITCSVQKHIDSLSYRGQKPEIQCIDLWYFDWKTNARKGEIKAGEEFANYLEFDLGLQTEHTVIKVHKMFKNVLSACNMTSTRLTDKDAKGAGSHEAESAISYVPYRNTLLMTLAAARAEQLYPGEEVHFIIGANLSEGMVYLDNSETWLTYMNDLIKVGGQSSINFSVVAPYVNRTKTEMIKDSIKNEYQFDTAFSCYFPVKGKECGVCGSCLLKKNAIERGSNDE